MLEWVLIDEPLGYREDLSIENPVVKGPARCHCGLFVKRGGRCAREKQVFREGTACGWEHL